MVPILPAFLFDLCFNEDCDLRYHTENRYLGAGECTQEYF